MSTGPGGAQPAGFTGDDLALLAQLSRGNDWLRAVLCTLARRGTALRQSDAVRAQAWIDALAVYPWFKGGQFLFDLMEWEDFMVDGPPPEPVSTVLALQTWPRLTDAINRLRALVDDAAPTSADAQPPAPDDGVRVTVDDADLPPLEPGLHLYRDVVLGVVVSVPPVSGAGAR